MLLRGQLIPDRRSQSILALQVSKCPTRLAFFNSIERLRTAWSKGPNPIKVELQKAIANAQPVATGLRNEG